PFLFRTVESVIPVFFVAGFFALMGMASGVVYPRYTLLISPLLAASLAALLSKIVPPRPGALLVAGILSVASGGPFRSADELGLLESSQTQYMKILENFRSALKPRESFVTCDWGRERP